MSDLPVHASRIGDGIVEFARAQPAGPARREVFPDGCRLPAGDFPIDEQEQPFIGGMSIQTLHQPSLPSAADNRASDLAREFATLPRETPSTSAISRYRRPSERK